MPIVRLVIYRPIGNRVLSILMLVKTGSISFGLLRVIVNSPPITFIFDVLSMQAKGLEKNRNGIAYDFWLSSFFFGLRKVNDPSYPFKLLLLIFHIVFLC